MLILGFLFIVLIVFSVLVMALVRNETTTQNQQRRDLNASVFADRLSELEDDFNNHRITEAELGDLKTELQKSLLDDARTEVKTITHESSHKKFAWLAIALIPLVSVLLYFSFPGWTSFQHWQDLIAQDELMRQKQQVDTKWLEGLTNQELLLLLRTRLHQKSDDLQGWLTLGQTLAQLGLSVQAMESVERALILEPNDLYVRLNLVQVMLMIRSDEALKKASHHVLWALDQAPEHEGALTLAGFVMLQQKNYQQAIDYWQHLLELRSKRGQAEGNGVEVITAQIAQAKRLLEEQSQVVLSDFALTVHLDVEQSIKTSIDSNATVFLTVRGDDKMPAPVAVKRMQVADLPVTLTLSDADAMIPGRVMSRMNQLVLSARISFSGTATPQTGDFESESVVWIKGMEHSLFLLIDKKRL